MTKPIPAQVSTRGKRAPSPSKGSINLRMAEDARRLIDDAAAVLGQTRTEFMIDSARRHAIDVMLDQRLFTLDARSFESFAKSLDRAPPPGPKLRALMHRTPVWDT